MSSESRKLLVTTLRWIAIPLAVIGGYIGAVVIARILVWTMVGAWTSDDGKTVAWFIPRNSVDLYVGEAIKSIFGPWGSIRFAQYVAPKAKLAVASVAGLVWIVSGGALLGMLAILWREVPREIPPPISAIMIGAWIGSAGVAVWQTYRESQINATDLQSARISFGSTADAQSGDSGIEKASALPWKQATVTTLGAVLYLVSSVLSFKSVYFLTVPWISRLFVAFALLYTAYGFLRSRDKVWRVAGIFLALEGIVFSLGRLNNAVWSMECWIAGVFTGVASLAQLMVVIAIVCTYRSGSEATASAEVVGRVDESQSGMTESEAIDIAVRFGETYAECNDEHLIFKPEFRLPCSKVILDRAMKISYQTGFPHVDQLEGSYKFCYPQVAFFVDDTDFERAESYFARLREVFSKDAHHPAAFDIRLACSHINSSPILALIDEAFDGQELSGRQLVEQMDQFFGENFLDEASDEPDRTWVRDLAWNCWQEMIRRIREWDDFRHLVMTGESGLELQEVALARIALNRVREMELELEGMRVREVPAR